MPKASSRRTESRPRFTRAGFLPGLSLLTALFLGCGPGSNPVQEGNVDSILPNQGALHVQSDGSAENIEETTNTSIDFSENQLNLESNNSNVEKKSEKRELIQSGAHGHSSYALFEDGSLSIAYVTGDPVDPPPMVKLEEIAKVMSFKEGISFNSRGSWLVVLTKQGDLSLYFVDAPDPRLERDPKVKPEKTKNLIISKIESVSLLTGAKDLEFFTVDTPDGVQILKKFKPTNKKERSPKSYNWNSPNNFFPKGTNFYRWVSGVIAEYKGKLQFLELDKNTGNLSLVESAGIQLPGASRFREDISLSNLPDAHIILVIEENGILAPYYINHNRELKRAQGLNFALKEGDRWWLTNNDFLLVVEKANGTQEIYALNDWFDEGSDKDLHNYKRFPEARIEEKGVFVVVHQPDKTVALNFNSFQADIFSEVDFSFLDIQGNVVVGYKEDGGVGFVKKWRINDKHEWKWKNLMENSTEKLERYDFKQVVAKGPLCWGIKEDNSPVLLRFKGDNILR